MSVASRELCDKLFKLSKWVCSPSKYGQRYDLGFLMRKLPNKTEISKVNLGLYEAVCYPFDRYKSEHLYYDGAADTPEDAACSLAITLFEAEILTNDEE